MNKFLSIIAGMCVAAVAVVWVMDYKPQQALGSVTKASEYQATSTKKINGLPGVQNLTVLQTGSCTLGSVIITGANTGTITLYDATSTVTNTEWATTTIASFPASTAAGTYTFDAICYKGLMIETSGSVPTSTITSR